MNRRRRPARPTRRAVRRRLQPVRSAFRVFVALTFFVATSPKAAADPLPRRSVQRIDRESQLEQANAATVKIVAMKRDGRRRSRTSGAGVVISASGYVATAAHVVHSFSVIRVLTMQGDVMPAQVVMTDHAWDIAVLRVVPERPLTVAAFAHPSSLRSGKETVVIGNPLGMGQSVSRGTVSELRTVNWEDCRQTLRTIEGDFRHGHSGGGTFDAVTGELLGINVAKSSVHQRTGYVVPIDRLVAIVNRRLPIVELVDSDEIDRRLGVRLRSVRLIDGSFEHGMLITAVRPGSRAHDAGWEIGDVLVGMDRYKVVDQESVLYVLNDRRAEGDTAFLIARGDDLCRGHVDCTPQSAVAAAPTPSRPARTADRYALAASAR